MTDQSTVIISTNFVCVVEKKGLISNIVIIQLLSGTERHPKGAAQDRKRNADEERAYESEYIYQADLGIPRIYLVAERETCFRFCFWSLTHKQRNSRIIS